MIGLGRWSQEYDWNNANSFRSKHSTSTLSPGVVFVGRKPSLCIASVHLASNNNELGHVEDPRRYSTGWFYPQLLPDGPGSLIGTKTHPNDWWWMFCWLIGWLSNWWILNRSFMFDGRCLMMLDDRWLILVGCWWHDPPSCRLSFHSNHLSLTGGFHPGFPSTKLAKLQKPLSAASSDSVVLRCQFHNWIM